LGISRNAKILDFGAGKATTMKRVVDARPDLIPYVFDVSADYLEHWAEWVALENTATYKLPQHWGDKFDVITAHFVLEHVQSPVEILKEISHCLAPEGRLFFSVPDVEGNTGDLLVVDHLNHFTLASITNALAKSNLIIYSIDRTVFSGAFVIVAKKGKSNTSTLIDNSNLQDTLSKWKNILNKLVVHKLDGPVAIYGAGFYGSLISTRLRGGVRCFIDKNPYLQDQEHLGLPVYSPNRCPEDIKFVIAGLNPANARNILSNSADWLPKSAEIIYLD
jgi:SAM-dependent methyltransferase